MNYREIGQRIREMRRKLGYTQEQLAEKSDISVNYLSQIESGCKKFSVETIIHITSSLNVTLDYIIFGNTENYGDKNIDSITLSLRSCSKKQINFISDMVSSMIKHLN